MKTLPPPSFAPGVAIEVEPGLRRILAPNPGPMTLWGTNTYLVGNKEVALVDPGPDMEEHLTAILAALGPDERIAQIIVSHAHKDHLGLAERLKDATRAPILGWQAVDAPFRPDIALVDGQILQGPDWQLEVIHTPGHTDDHVCLGFRDTCLTADHVMGWSSSVIIPPRGDVADYITSLEKLAARPWRRLHSAHGDPMEDPAERLAYLIRHRIAREESIVKALRRRPMTLEALVSQLYATTPRTLHGAATRNVEAHLIHLLRTRRVSLDEASSCYETIHDELSSSG